MEIRDIRDEIRADMGKLPDLERIESSIHSMGSKYLASEHEMHKAVMYETKVYRQRKTAELNAALSGFEKANDIVQDFRSQIISGGIQLKSDTLRMLLDISAEGVSSSAGSKSWPDLTSIIKALRVVAPKPRKGYEMVIHLGSGSDGCT